HLDTRTCFRLFPPLLLTLVVRSSHLFFFFFFNATAPPEIYTLSLHDALPISQRRHARRRGGDCPFRAHRLHPPVLRCLRRRGDQDRKSTRLNSSHLVISYAVFCLKKKNKTNASAHITTLITLRPHKKNRICSS